MQLSGCLLGKKSKEAACEHYVLMHVPLWWTSWVVCVTKFSFDHLHKCGTKVHWPTMQSKLAMRWSTWVFDLLCKSLVKPLKVSSHYVFPGNMKFAVTWLHHFVCCLCLVEKFQQCQHPSSMVVWQPEQVFVPSFMQRLWWRWFLPSQELPRDLHANFWFSHVCFVITGKFGFYMLRKGHFPRDPRIKLIYEMGGMSLPAVQGCWGQEVTLFKQHCNQVDHISFAVRSQTWARWRILQRYWCWCGFGDFRIRGRVFAQSSSWHVLLCAVCVHSVLVNLSGCCDKFPRKILVLL